MRRHVVLLVAGMLTSCAVALYDLALPTDALISVELCIDDFELLSRLLAGVLDVFRGTVGWNHLLVTVD